MSLLVCWVAFFNATLKNSKKRGEMARALLFIPDRGCSSPSVLVTPGCYTVPHWHPCRSLINTMLMDGLSGKGNVIQPSDTLVRMKEKTFDFFMSFSNKMKTFDLVFSQNEKKKKPNFFIYISHFWGEGSIQLKTGVFQPWGKLPSYCLSFFIGTNRHIVKMWASFFFFLLIL